MQLAQLSKVFLDLSQVMRATNDSSSNFVSVVPYQGSYDADYHHLQEAIKKIVEQLLMNTSLGEKRISSNKENSSLI